MLVYNQSAICVPKPKGFKDLVFLKMYRTIFAYFHLVTLSAEMSKVDCFVLRARFHHGTALTQHCTTDNPAQLHNEVTNVKQL